MKLQTTNRQKDSLHNPVRKYINLFSRDTGKWHLVTFLRRTGIKRWMCDCQDFLYRRFAMKRHCKHIKRARRMA